MIFELKDFYIDNIENNDIEEICRIYNSNENFLLHHLDVNKVDSKWVLEEINSSKKAGFEFCKIIEKFSGKKIGIVDFKVGEEVYLSLLILHSDFKEKGIGKSFVLNFEEYIKSLKIKCIRIDVVTNYADSAFDFWINNGFIESEDVDLNWSGKILSAVTMRKKL